MKANFCCPVSLSLLCCLFGSLLLNLCICRAEGHGFDLLRDVKQFELVTPKLLSQVELQETSSKYADHVEYEIQAFGKNLHVVLEKNKELFAPGYTELRYGANNEITEESTPSMGLANCHYVGYEKNQRQSTVALSTCDGVRGLISTEDNSYYIEPAAPHLHLIGNRLNGMNPQDAHVVYRVQDLVQPHYECGVNHDFHEQEHGSLHGHSFQQLINQYIPNAQNNNNDNDNSLPFTHRRGLKQSGTTLYVELLFANDLSRYKVLGANTEARSASYLNLMNTFYTNSNFNPQIKIVLVAQVTFTVADPYTYSFSGSEVDINTLLNNFHRWRSTAAIPSHDAGQLLSNMDFSGSVIGYAGVGSMCQRSFSGGIIQSTFSDLVNSMVCAHEMGHNFGMNHDSTGNSCPASGSIMAAISCSNCSPNTVFSSCSKDSFNSWYSSSSSRASCLLNIPTTTFGQRCGNGLKEDGEECDCGVSCAQDPCCDGTTCKLRTTAPTGGNGTNYPAKCSALDPCCSNCQLIPFSSQKLCRASKGFCDLPEVCSGFSSTCPEDEYKAAGSLCDDSANNGGQCFQGSCLSLKSQCSALNGVFPTLSPMTSCNYQSNWGSCGKLYCGSNGNGNSCSSFTTGGSQVMVANGTACGANSQCSGGSCVSSASLNPVTTYSYQATSWSSCNAVCGTITGSQTRVVACVSSFGNVVDNSKCGGAAMPVNVQTCVPSTADLAKCPAVSYAWTVGAWTGCSASCSTGIRTRSVFCKNQQDNSIVTDALCLSSSTPKPATQEGCNTDIACSTPSNTNNTPNFWFVSLWSPCSVTCGTGTQTRVLSCRTSLGVIAPETTCATSSRPTSQQQCSTGIQC